jgi:purine-binding chemotaxis protein CheW
VSTETALIVDLQHRYLREAHSRIHHCLEIAGQDEKHGEQILREIWQLTHALKGEAGVVGFHHLGQFLEDVEAALGRVESALKCDMEEKNRVTVHVRFVSALKEALYGLENYISALEREYKDAEGLYMLEKESIVKLAHFEVKDDSDWGMASAEERSQLDRVFTKNETASAPSQVSAEAQNIVQALGSGFDFDLEVLEEFKRLQKQNPKTSEPAVSVKPFSEGASPAPDHKSTSQFQSQSENVSSNQGQQNSNQKWIHSPSAKTPEPQSSSATSQNSSSSGFVAKEKNLDKSLYLVVTSDALSYAVPLSQVLEIVESRRWNPLPRERRHILGVINLRGSVLPVCDFDGVVGDVRSAPSDQGKSTALTARCIVVLSVGEKKFGLPVQAVSHVTEISLASLSNLSEAGIEAAQSVVTHSALVDGKTLMIVDMARFRA